MKKQEVILILLSLAFLGTALILSRRFQNEDGFTAMTYTEYDNSLTPPYHGLAKINVHNIKYLHQTAEETEKKVVDLQSQVKELHTQLAAVMKAQETYLAQTIGSQPIQISTK